MNYAKIAEEIVDDLFTNGEGEKANRLVLELENKKDGGGWCKIAVVNIILDKLKELTHEPNSE